MERRRAAEEGLRDRPWSGEQPSCGPWWWTRFSAARYLGSVHLRYTTLAQFRSQTHVNPKRTPSRVECTSVGTSSERHAVGTAVDAHGSPEPCATLPPNGYGLETRALEPRCRPF